MTAAFDRRGLVQNLAAPGSDDRGQPEGEIQFGARSAAQRNLTAICCLPYRQVLFVSIVRTWYTGPVICKYSPGYARKALAVNVSELPFAKLKPLAKDSFKFCLCGHIRAETITCRQRRKRKDNKYD